MKISSINIQGIVSSLKYGICMLASQISNKKRVWLISEREDQARDNGYIFFKYMREYHPEEKVYYLIKPDSKDISKIESYGNIISFNSWKHYYYYCVSKVHISAHVNGCCPEGAIGISRRTKALLGFKDVFIPHGVSYGISEFCLQKYAKINLFICSGKKEYENVLNHYGYQDKEVAYTGFPRLDIWHNIKVNPKQIVLMPTWRTYLAQNEDTNFLESDYFKSYQSLINNIELQEFLENNNLEFVFYLHNNMRKYVEYFKTTCRNIIVVDQDEMYDIQELLKSAALLITDYSSVHFDFAYMNKPVLYYQFDQEEFYKKQYQNSGFQAENDGYGPVVKLEKDLIEQIKSLYCHNFSVKEFYTKRMREFYVLYDNHNCERVYQVIKERCE